MSRDVVLNIAPEDYMPLMIRSGAWLAHRLDRGEDRSAFGSAARLSELDAQMRKAPLKVVVVDTIAKTPTEI